MGSKQVEVAHVEDKRQITAVVASNAVGELLPLQLVFTGKTDGVIPALPSSVEASCTANGMHFTHTHNHWSSLETMMEYMKSVVDPFVKKQNKGQHAVLIFDCWSVHRSEEFRKFL